VNGIGSTTTTTVGVKLKSRILMEVSVGETSVRLDWSAARALLADLKDQIEKSDIVRINAKCVTSYSMISNFPLARGEVKELLRDLEWYVED